jgi:hypothetical protein
MFRNYWSPVNTVTKLRTVVPGSRKFHFLEGKEIFSVFHRVKMALEPTQTSVHCVSGVKWQGRELTTDLHLVPRSRMVKLKLQFPIHLKGMVLN